MKMKMKKLEAEFYKTIGYCFDPGFICHRDFTGNPVGKKAMSFDEKVSSFPLRWESLKSDPNTVHVWTKFQPSTQTKTVSEIVQRLIECSKSSPTMAAYIGYGVFYWSREFEKGLRLEGCSFDEKVKEICIKYNK